MYGFELIEIMTQIDFEIVCIGAEIAYILAWKRIE